MADFPYTPNPASLPKFLTHIQSAGVPEKVTQKYLDKVGFKSKNDRYIISVLKALRFLDESGSPTETWQQYRNKSQAASMLAGAIRETYSDLFSTFPDAQRKDTEALRNYFSAHSQVAESTLGLMVKTFRALCSLADFDAKPTVDTTSRETVLPSAKAAPAPKQRGATAGPTAPVININVQLQLPATEDGEIYDKLFSALRKHVLS